MSEQQIGAEAESYEHTPRAWEIKGLLLGKGPVEGS